MVLKMSSLIFSAANRMTIKKCDNKPMLLSKMNNARNAIATFFIYLTNVVPCWYIVRFCMQDRGTKKSVWIVIGIWFTTRNLFTNTSNTKQFIGVWAFDPHNS